MMSKTKKLLFYAGLILAITACLPDLGHAKSKISIHVDEDKIRNEDVYVAKDEKVDGDIIADGTITVDGVVEGDCVSLGKEITINGEVKGDVATLGGPVKISGQVNGDIASLGGDVSLESNAKVFGDVALLGGKLTKAEAAFVTGDVTTLDLGLIKRLLPLASHFYKLPSAKEKSTLMNHGLFLSWLLGLGITILLLTVFLPTQIQNVATTIKKDFWKSAAIGVLILILVLPTLILMAISVLGIPIIPLALLLFCVASLMALSSFSLVLAERLYGSLQKPIPKLFVGVAVGYGLLNALLIIGKLLKTTGDIGGILGGIFILANFILFSCGLVVGLGATWTSRMGSREVK